MHLRILATLTLLGLTQCHKNAAPAAAETSTGLTLISTGGSPHFQAVASRLEVGAAAFTYTEEADVMELLGGFFEQVLKQMPEQERSKLPPNFSMKKMLALLGMDSIKASGASSRKVAEGMNHHRSFAYAPAGRQGLLSLTGGPAEPLLVPALAPQDADLALEFPLHLKDWAAAAWPVFLESAPPEQRGLIEAMATMPQPALGMSYLEMAQKLSVRVALAATLMPEQSLSAPGAPVSFPGVNAVIVIDKLGWIKDLLKRQVLPMFQGEASPVELQTVNGAVVGRFRAPMGPPPMDFQPAFQLDEAHDRLIIATRPGYFDAVMATTGKLGEQPDFAKVWKGLPTEGNGCLFLSKRLMGTVVDTLKNGVATEEKNPASREMALTVIDLVARHARYPQAVCFANLPDGILTASNSSLPATLSSGSFSSITSLAVLSSLAMPMVTSIQKQGKERKVLSNGRLVLAALKTYAAAHGGKYPADLQDLIATGALTSPELLMVTGKAGTAPAPWLYDSTVTPESPGVSIVLAAPVVVQGAKGRQTRAVIRNDGRAEPLAEEEFQRTKDYHLR